MRLQAEGLLQVDARSLGIGFYSQPHTRISRSRLPWICWILWTAGLMLHWLAAAYLWRWRITLPTAGLLQFAAMLLFLRAAREHKLQSAVAPQPARPRMEPWMQTVLVSNAAFLVALGINLVVSFRLALTAAAPETPNAFDQSFLVLLGWGFLAPLVWGFSARWLPTFLGVAPIRGKLLQMAVVLDLAGAAVGMAHQTRLMTPLLVAATILIVLAIRVFEKPSGAPKTLGLHPSFPTFLRIAYTWSIAASLLGVWASWSDHFPEARTKSAVGCWVSTLRRARLIRKAATIKEKPITTATNTERNDIPACLRGEMLGHPP